MMRNYPKNRTPSPLTREVLARANKLIAEGGDAASVIPALSGAFGISKSQATHMLTRAGLLPSREARP